MEGMRIPETPKVLVVGSGAREHAIVWALAQSPHRPRLYAAPGNPGMAALAECVPIAADDVEGLVSFAAATDIQLVMVGPEVPLSGGIADLCAEQGIRVFGPVRAAAQLESSKAFAKALMQSVGVPTAAYATFEDPEAAKRHVLTQGAPVVVKADGLAAGKGVVVAETVEAALAAIDEMMVQHRFGASGGRVVLESKLEGPELSLMFFVDGQSVAPMIPARDHKRVFDGDTGPNTGGMGAFAPVPLTTADLARDVEHRIVRPVLDALRSQGIVYRGVLYAGLMLTKDGPQVIEFNARFGDPETQAVLPLLASDLLEIAWAVTEDRLSEVPVVWRDACAVCVVLAAEGYPESPRKGDRIGFDHLDPKDLVFHAGTAARDGDLWTDGGRVLSVVGLGKDFPAARENAYLLARNITFNGKQHRSDIAQGQ